MKYLLMVSLMMVSSVSMAQIQKKPVPKRPLTCSEPALAAKLSEGCARNKNMKVKSCQVVNEKVNVTCGSANNSNPEKFIFSVDCVWVGGTSQVLGGDGGYVCKGFINSWKFQIGW